jgi:hypothetical protein
MTRTRSRSLKCSRSWGKHSMMDNENELVMKKTKKTIKTTTMMTNTNENDQKEEREKGEEKETERNNQRLPKQSRVFSSSNE